MIVFCPGGDLRPKPVVIGAKQVVFTQSGLLPSFPLGDVFGIHPVHLGIIFILNLEAGFMTPPVDINLFLASSRFGKPIMQICQYVIPFFLVRLAVLLLVAYIPWFSTWLPSLIK